MDTKKSAILAENGKGHDTNGAKRLKQASENNKNVGDQNATGKEKSIQIVKENENASGLGKMADYEINRRKRMEENRQEAEKLKLKENEKE